MGITRCLLASDLDGTLIPSGRNAQHVREVADLVSAIAANASLMLAYVTGRHLSLAQSGKREIGLPPPNWFVCDAGTSIYREANGGYEADEIYLRAMRLALGGLSGSDVRSAIGEIDGMELQEEEKQAEFKVSYYTKGRAESFLDTVQSRLDRADAKVNLVASHDTVTDRGLLDVLPAGIAKDYAVRYLQERSGVDPRHLVYAGDSGNDRAAMLSGYRAIVVGNADPAFKKDLGSELSARGIADRVYFAECPYAAGVLQGLRHFGFLS
ncbi:MAG: HAD-IIB family hydrolase [Polyangiales bacterium]